MQAGTRPRTSFGTSPSTTCYFARRTTRAGKSDESGQPLGGIHRLPCSIGRREIDSLVEQRCGDRLRSNKVARTAVVGGESTRCAVREVLQPTTAGRGDVAHPVRVVALRAVISHGSLPGSAGVRGE